jgi:hypothetical protein
VFAWQIFKSPTDGLEAAYGLYLTWIAWLIALAGTAALALRGPVGPPRDASQVPTS